MSSTEKLLDKFAQGHRQHVQCIADIAGSDNLCCSGMDPDSDLEEFEEDEQEGLERAARQIMDDIPGFLTYFVPKRMVPSDSKWRSILTSVRSFYRWCVAEKFISRDCAMDKSLLTLRKLPLNSLPKEFKKKLINWLGSERYWDKLERQESEAVKTVEERLDNWRRHAETAQYEYPFRLRDDNPNDYDKVLGMSARLEIQEIRDDGWLLELVNGRTPLPFENDEHIVLKNGERVFVRLPKKVAHLGVLGLALSCFNLGLRNDIWRPLANMNDFAAFAYPSQDMFEEGSSYCPT